MMQVSLIHTFYASEGSEPGLVNRGSRFESRKGHPFFIIIVYPAFTHAVQSTFTKQCGRRADVARRPHCFNCTCILILYNDSSYLLRYCWNFFPI